MKICITKKGEILNKNLSISEKGVLLSIMLTINKDADVSLVKLKREIRISQYKAELISLHEKGIIEWSGYKVAKKSLEREDNLETVVEILNFMSNLYKRGFSPTDSRITTLSALLKSYSILEIKSVIANRYLVWKDDEIMKKHLVPDTIFRPSKFIKYLEEVKSTRKGESLVVASKIKLKQDDVITYDIAKTFIDSEIYNFKSYNLNSKGERQGLPIKESRYGKEIKWMLKVQKNKEQKDFVLTYIEQ